MTKIDLAKTLRRLAHPRLLVVGDLMLDRYTWGNADRISQEAPVIVLRAQRREERLGGAANVCHMLRALLADVTCAGVVGDDSAGRALRKQLLACGTNADDSLVLVDPTRPTSLKERFVGLAGTRHPNQMLRVDTESDQPLAEDLVARLVAQIQARIRDFDAVLLSDYAKGVLAPTLIAEVVLAARQAGCPVLVDPGRGRDVAIYRGATLIKPNRLETSLATNRSIDDAPAALQAGQELCQRCQIDQAVVTLDRDGIVWVARDGRSEIYPTEARSVYDITGAGDIVLSVLGLCLAAGESSDVAVRLANVAAGLEVQRAGVAAITREEIQAELIQGSPHERKHVDLAEAARRADECRRRGQRIVFTNGCFDLLHVGHVTYLQEAAAHGEVLIVAVNSDQSVRRLKGPERPIISQQDRVAMLAALGCVDQVIVFDEPTPHELLRAIRPDVLIKGGTYTTEQVVGHEIVTAYGGEVRVTGVVDGVSTTRIVESISHQTLRKAG